MTTTSSATAAPRILTRSTADLLSQVAWFNRLRLGVVGGMAVLSAIAWQFALVVDSQPLWLLTAATLVVDLGYMAWFPRLSGVSTRSVRRHVDVQIAVDLLILTAMLHFSGGVTNPFVLSYLFHAFIAALLLSVRAALLVIGVSVALVGGLAFAERYGALPHHVLSVGLMDLRETSVVTLATWLAAFAATLVLSVYFVATVLARLGRREQQLARMDKQLSQSEKLASVGNLAAGVAHEINNPVGVIQAKVQILRYRISDGEPSGVLLEDLDTVERHVGRIRSITHGLLAFSREEPFALAPLDLNPLVKEGMELVAVPFRTDVVNLEVHLAPSAPRVMGSQNHLLQVLVNIVLNAKDASERGSTVAISTFVEGAEAGVRIEDHGGGIDAEDLPKIFDPFFTTKDVDRGTGLGLAISHGIVERHNGRISVESEAGRGSTFTIWLPRVVEDQL